MAGWIKWYRQAELNKVLNDGKEPFDRLHAFLWLVENANTKTIKSSYATVNRGQVFTSIRIMAEKWRWSRGRVLRFLDELEANGMITKKSDTKKTVVTIEKYAIFQSVRDTNGTTRDTNGTTNDTTKKTPSTIEKYTISRDEWDTIGTTNGATNGTHNKNTEERKEKAGMTSLGGSSSGTQKKVYHRPPVENWDDPI